jgi:large subunit ribosomal protein L16
VDAQIKCVAESNFLKLKRKCYSLKKQNFVSSKRGRMKGNSGRGHQLSNGTFGIKSLDSSFITARQIEAARVAATRYMKREGSLWIKIFPDKPITKKPLEVRMGKGKGAVEYWAAVVKPGRILFEVSGVPIEVAREALRLAAQKLPVKTKFIVARDYEA